MGKGRKTIPRSIKLLMGNPGKRPLRDEPQATEVLPQCPVWLDETARQEWNRLEGIALWIRGVDALILAAYCMAYSRWLAAEKMITEQGMTTTTAAAGLKKHPAVSISLESMTLMKGLAAELGLTPSSRTRIGTTTAAPGLKLKKFVG